MVKLEVSFARRAISILGMLAVLLAFAIVGKRNAYSIAFFFVFEFLLFRQQTRPYMATDGSGRFNWLSIQDACFSLYVKNRRPQYWAIATARWLGVSVHAIVAGTEFSTIPHDKFTDHEIACRAYLFESCETARAVAYLLGAFQYSEPSKLKNYLDAWAGQEFPLELFRRFLQLLETEELRNCATRYWIKPRRVPAVEPISKTDGITSPRLLGKTKNNWVAKLRSLNLTNANQVAQFLSETPLDDSGKKLLLELVDEKVLEDVKLLCGEEPEEDVTDVTVEKNELEQTVHFTPKRKARKFYVAPTRAAALEFIKNVSGQTYGRYRDLFRDNAEESMRMIEIVFNELGTKRSVHSNSWDRIVGFYHFTAQDAEVPWSSYRYSNGATPLSKFGTHGHLSILIQPAAYAGNQTKSGFSPAAMLGHRANECALSISDIQAVAEQLGHGELSSNRHLRTEGLEGDYIVDFIEKVEGLRNLLYPRGETNAAYHSAVMDALAKIRLLDHSYTVSPTTRAVNLIQDGTSLDEIIVQLAKYGKDNRVQIAINDEILIVSTDNLVKQLELKERVNLLISDHEKHF